MMSTLTFISKFWVLKISIFAGNPENELENRTTEQFPQYNPSKILQTILNNQKPRMRLEMCTDYVSKDTRVGDDFLYPLP